MPWEICSEFIEVFYDFFLKNLFFSLMVCPFYSNRTCILVSRNIFCFTKRLTVYRSFLSIDFEMLASLLIHFSCSCHQIVDHEAIVANKLLQRCFLHLPMSLPSRSSRTSHISRSSNGSGPRTCLLFVPCARAHVGLCYVTWHCGKWFYRHASRKKCDRQWTCDTHAYRMPSCRSIYLSIGHS